MLDVALRSITHGLQHREPLQVNPADYPEALGQHRATFVTLTLGGELRGCIGVLEARDPLVVDVAHNAYSAAFSDPRFTPLTGAELSRLEIKISVLTPPVPINFETEPDLLRQLRPGVDGLILEDGLHRGTFLPAVWQSLPNPRDFLCHLKIKAGLAPGYWSNSLRIARYRAEEIG